MKILVAPNAFKGTLSAFEAGRIICDQLKIKYPEAIIQLTPIADGGDGTCQLLSESLGLEPFHRWSLGPLGRPAKGVFFLKDESAYLDVSKVSGLGLLASNELDVKTASTFGTGLLIREAVKAGAKEIVLGLGGSATVDIGVGILQALGIQFLDQNGRELIPFSPDFLNLVKHVQRSPTLPKIEFTLLCDVKNSFLGSEGAIPVYGPQKGLANEDLASYEAQCTRLLKLMYKKTNRDFIDKSGFGAAGGIAAGLSAFFDVKIAFGASYIFNALSIDKDIKDADLIITGEGRYDSQSRSGKACYELLQLAKKYQKEIYLITSGDEGFDEGFSKVIQLPDLDFNSPDFKKKAARNLEAVCSKQWFS